MQLNDIRDHFRNNNPQRRKIIVASAVLEKATRYGARTLRDMRETMLNEALYEMGFKLGSHWSRRDATPEQQVRVSQFDDGEGWVATHSDPAREFTRAVDPEKSDFMGIGEVPSASFVAGFIDGAKSISTSA